MGFLSVCVALQYKFEVIEIGTFRKSFISREFFYSESGSVCKHTAGLPIDETFYYFGYVLRVYSLI